MQTPETLLRDWRTHERLGPKSAGERVGVNRVTWWRWEMGLSKVGLDALDRVASETGIPRQSLRPDIFKEAAQ